MSWRTLLATLRGRRTDEPEPAPSLPPSPPAPSGGAQGIGFALLLDRHGDDACVGCGLCAQVCPPQVIRLEPGPVAVSPHTGRPRGWVSAFRLDVLNCIACELCMQVCPTDAIRLFPDPARVHTAPMLLEDLRAAGSRVRGRRRSPLGPMPVPTPDPPPVIEPATGSPTPMRQPAPARDLASPGWPGHDLDVLPHMQELGTSEPTRIESFHHPIDAPTEPELDPIGDGLDPGDWDPGDPVVDGDELSHFAEIPTQDPHLDTGIDLSEQLEAPGWVELAEDSTAFPAVKRRHISRGGIPRVPTEEDLDEEDSEEGPTVDIQNGPVGEPEP